MEGVRKQSNLTMDLKTYLWGPIDFRGTIHLEMGWACGPIPGPRIRTYPRMIS